ncbi:MAG: hypothetical protein RIR18_37 [Pseudomonadota bacterium]|jgi:hypothetical protein
MINKMTKQMTTIKALDFKQWTVSFWLVKRRIEKHTARYSVLRVNTDKKLQNRLRGYLKQQLQSRDFHLAEYAFSNADGDDTLFTIAADTTDFPKVEKAINDGFNNGHVTQYDELLNSWAYVVLFENGNDRLFAWRKISTATQPKKVKARQATFFFEQKLVDIEDKDIFMIAPRFDFFVHEGTILIANKKEFESSMNFREGMKAKAAEVIKDFAESKIFQNVGLIEKYVGDNLHRLRKMASILKSGYYKQDDYIKKMIQVSKEEGWELKVVDGEILVEEETIELLLKLLNNERLHSLINGEVFDASVKTHVNAGKASASAS